MLTPPVCLIDLDGVISPFASEIRNLPIPPERRAQLTALHADSYAGDFLIDRNVTGALAGLHHSGALHLEWNSSWEEDARDLVGPLLGAPYDRLPVHLASEQSDSREWAKLQAVLGILDRGKRVIWWHDTGILAGHPDVLMVCPPQNIGLTMADVRQIEQWARRG